MKNTFQSPRKPSPFSQSPITATRRGGVIEEQDEEEEEEGGEIVLVDGPNPRVVQEEKDLVILEEVDEPVPQSTVQIQPPKTPQRRRSQSLHRSVLIRSAQRAVVEHERQQKEEEEEREEEIEVADTIANADVSSDESPGGTPQTYHGGLSSDEETDGDKDQAPEDTNQDRRKSLWRKSIEKLWPFRNSTEELEVTYFSSQKSRFSNDSITDSCFRITGMGRRNRKRKVREKRQKTMRGMRAKMNQKHYLLCLKQHQSAVTWVPL